MQYSSGIYAISNRISGKVYIGQSQQIEKRWYKHKYMLRKGIHENRMLQRAWLKHGELAFSFRILYRVAAEHEITAAEQWWMHFTGAAYNFCQIAQSTRGTKHTDSARAKMRAFWNSPEQLAAKVARYEPMRRPRGPRSEATKAKLRAISTDWHQRNKVSKLTS